MQRRLWSLAGEAIGAAPLASAPRLYVDALNSMIDEQTVRVSALNNRVPGAVLALEVFGASVALGLLGLYLSVLGRGIWPMVFATALVTMLLLVTFDLDRPTRGLITVPDTPYMSLRASMRLPAPPRSTRNGVGLSNLADRRAPPQTGRRRSRGPRWYARGHLRPDPGGPAERRGTRS